MSDLTNKIIENFCSNDVNDKRLIRQLKHIEKAIENTTDEKQLDFLYSSFQSINWCRSPDSFAPPVQMLDSLQSD